MVFCILAAMIMYKVRHQFKSRSNVSKLLKREQSDFIGFYKKQVRVTTTKIINQNISYDCIMEQKDN